MDKSRKGYENLLKRAIIRALKQGRSKYEITQELLKRHWPQNIIEHTFKTIDFSRYQKKKEVQKEAEKKFIFTKPIEEKKIFIKTKIVTKKVVHKKPSLFSRLFTHKEKHIETKKPEKPKAKPIIKKEERIKRKSFFKRIFARKRFVLKPKKVTKKIIEKKPSFFEKVFKFETTARPKVVPKKITGTVPPEIKKQKSNTKMILIIAVLLVALLTSILIYLFISSPKTAGETRVTVVNQIIGTSTLIIVLGAIVTVLILFVIALYIKNTLGKKKKEITKPKPQEVTKSQKTLKQVITETKGEYQTDYDKLYSALQKMDKISIEDIAKVFNISEKEAEGRAKILEEHNLGKIEYTLLGSPILVKKKKEEEKND